MLHHAAVFKIGQEGQKCYNEYLMFWWNLKGSDAVFTNTPKSSWQSFFLFMWQMKFNVTSS